MKRLRSLTDSIRCGNMFSPLGHPQGAATLRLAAARRGSRPRRPYEVTRGSSDAETLERAQRSASPLDDQDPRTRIMRLEAVLLLAKTPLTTRKLAQLAHLADGTEARTLVRRLNRTYESYARALRVEQVAGGYRLLTRPSLAPWLARLGHLPPALRLSTPMMETLAVVAYRQPVSRADAEAVRGVACGELLRQLMERDLIRIAGRGEELGRPYLYGTTKRFLQLFGLSSADDLPPIRWQTLHEDQPDGLADTATQDSPQEVFSTSPKESVVSTAIASVLSEADPKIHSMTGAVTPQSDALPAGDPRAEIDEDEDDWDDDDDDDEDEDDWDDEEDEDWDDEDESDDELDEDEDELDDDEEDEWEEVDDEDDDEEDEDWDDEDEDDEVDDVDDVDDEEWDDEEAEEEDWE